MKKEPGRGRKGEGRGSLRKETRPVFVLVPCLPCKPISVGYSVASVEPERAEQVRPATVWFRSMRVLDLDTEDQGKRGMRKGKEGGGGFFPSNRYP